MPLLLILLKRELVTVEIGFLARVLLPAAHNHVDVFGSSSISRALRCYFSQAIRVEPDRQTDPTQCHESWRSCEWLAPPVPPASWWDADHYGRLVEIPDIALVKSATPEMF